MGTKNIIISQKKISEYINKNGKNCPRCGSNYLRGGCFEFEGEDSTDLTQIITCERCYLRWDDMYKLIDIKDVHESDPTEYVYRDCN